MQGILKGPEGSPYEGGWYLLDIKLPPSYPFHPPNIVFQTKVWHPNISSETGVICLDILKKEWSPVLTIKTVLMSIQALLQSPAPDDPQDAVVARQLLSTPTEFRNTARFWTETFASVLVQEQAKLVHIKELVGKPIDERRLALLMLRFDLDENRVLSHIMG